MRRPLLLAVLLGLLSPACSIVLAPDNADLEESAYTPWQLEPIAEPLEGGWVPETGCVINTGSATTAVGQTAACNNVDFLDNGDWVELRAANILINGMVRVNGERPLVLIAHTLAINGTLELTSPRGNGLSQPQGCGSRDATLDVGGSGGGFAEQGAPGGTINATGTPGDAIGLDGIDRIRVGCGGGATGGARAPGGGGIQLVAVESLTIRGGVHANGQGGGGGKMNEPPGGGGGSGGMIVLDSPDIDVGGDAEITAVGGGGGAAFDATLGDGPSADFARGAGCSSGATSASSSTGGDGACMGNAPTPGQMLGGGGGSSGYIFTHGGEASISADALFDPTFEPAPGS